MTTKDRRLLQMIGEKMREIDPDIWLKAAFKEASKYEKVVIADCRRENEYTYAIENEFTPIRVKADLGIRIERCRIRDGVEPNTDEWENSSETGADFCRFFAEIENDGTMEQLYEKIDELLGVS